MTTLLFVFVIMVLAMGAMSLGVILSNRALKGSCGGSGQDCLCEIEKRRACHALKHFDKARLAHGDGRAAVWDGPAPR